MLSRLSLKYRIALIIFILEAMMMSVVLWQTLGQSYDESEDLIANHEEAILQLVSGISRSSLITEEYAELQPYITHLIANSEATRLYLADSDRTIVASSLTTDLGQTLTDLNNREQHQWKIREINNASGLLGILAIEFSDRKLTSAYTEARDLGVTIALLGMIIIASVGILVGFLLTRRLEIITQTAKRLSKGDFSARTQIQGQDELGTLARTFDEMTVNLQEANNQIQQLNKDLEMRVHERTAELRSVNQELESFAYSVSHDLRTPLRAIDGYSHALGEDYGDRLDKEGKEYLDRVRKGAQRMGILIDDLLQLSRINRVELEKKEVDLRIVAEEVIEELKAGDPNKKVDIKIGHDLKVFGDPQLLRVLMDNLLGNAWKFTGRESVASMIFDHDTKNPNVFYVRDNGVGFSKSNENKLFGAFERLHNISEFPGSGVGLATVKRIVNRHGGEVWAEAQEGEGATFFFTLTPKN